MVDNVIDRINDLQISRPVLLDLFCGCGGFTKGLHDTDKFDIIAGIDIWDRAIATYEKNFDHLAICKDLCEYSPERFKEDHKIEKIDIIVGGIPCQSFSLAGQRKKDDKRGVLYKEYLKYIDFYKPKMFVIENVIGILSMKNQDNQKIIDIIIDAISDRYNHKIFKLYASDFEVPQNRRRVFIIGILRSLNKQLNDIDLKIKDKKDRIPVSSILEADVDRSYYLSDRAIQGIKNKKERAIANNNGFGAQFLDMHLPSYTIPARYWKDGYDALVRYDDNNIRRLTILELKRIQSFPDDYEFAGSKKDIITQIGNAVPCKLGYYIGIYLSQALL